MELASKYFNWGNIIIVSILTALMYNFSPYIADDLMHINHWQIHLANNNENLWQAFGEYIRYHINVDSPRFFNSLLPIFLCGMPKWIVDCLMGVMWGITIILSCRLILIWNRRHIRTSILILMLVMFLPWDDCMISIAFSANYMWSLPLILLFLICLTDKTTNINPTFLIIIGLLTGWNHEAESLPLLIGATSWFIINRLRPSKKQLCLLVPMVIALTALLSILLTHRFSSQIESSTNFKLAIYILATKMPLTALTTATVAVMATFQSGRSKLANLKSSVLPISFVAMLAAACIGLMYWYHGERTCWYPEFFATLSLLILLNEIHPKPIINQSKTAWIIAIGISLTTIVHLITANIYIHKIGKQIENINDNYICGKSPNIFHELTHPSQTPLLAWNKLGITTVYTNNFRWYWQCRLYSETSIDYPIPAELKDVSINTLAKVPGNNPYYSFNGILVRPYDPKAAQPVQDKTKIYDYGKRVCRATLSYSLGAKRSIALNLSPFTANDGTRWLYAVPNYTDAQSRFCDIIEINP